ncbi:MAG: putative secreted Zn-dependent protease [Roseivirga sp.]|jgi:predicted secreted Zn-dependent protease
MRPVVFFILIGAFFSMTPLNGQSKEERQGKLIAWDEQRPLEWADYPFKRNRTGQYSAITSVKHSVKGYIRKGLPEFDIKVYFDLKESWTADSTDMNLLNHERLHFDIGEVYRRKIETKVKVLQSKNEKRAAVYRTEIKNILSAFNAYSKEYDDESENGRNEAEQLRWQTLVSEELKRLHK